MTDFIVDERVNTHDGSNRVHHSPRVNEDEQEDIEALERQVQDRYNGWNRTEYDEDDDDEATDVEQQARLPSVRDSKLWRVKCAVCCKAYFYIFFYQFRPIYL